MRACAVALACLMWISYGRRLGSSTVRFQGSTFASGRHEVGSLPTSQSAAELNLRKQQSSGSLAMHSVRRLARLLCAFTPASAFHSSGQSVVRDELRHRSAIRSGYRVPGRVCMWSAEEAKALGDWIAANGGAVKACDIADTPSGLGLVATEDVSAGHVFVRIPPKCMISANSPDASAVKSLCDACPEDYWFARLGLILLSERIKGEASHFHPYISSLPQYYYVPSFWSPTAIKALVHYPGDLYSQINQRARFFYSFAKERLQDGCEELQGCKVDMGALAWAAAACTSRAFTYGEENVMLPVIDIANHNGPATKNGLVKRNLMDMELVAIKPIKKGEEVTHGYGQFTNDGFMLDMGFIPANNTVDRIPMPWKEGGLLQVALQTANYERPLESWQRTAMDAKMKGVDYLFANRTGVDNQTLVVCRILAASTEDEFWKSDHGRQPLRLPSEELNALRIAASIVQTIQRSLPTEDDGLDENSDAFDIKLVSTFVKEKTELCDEAIDCILKKMEPLEKIVKEQPANDEKEAEPKGEGDDDAPKGFR